MRRSMNRCFGWVPTLTVDGRIGKVTDCQGLVSVKPVAHSRWTPIASHMVLKPRDWIRTDLRGANAAALRLATSIRVTLGPRHVGRTGDRRSA